MKKWVILAVVLTMVAGVEAKPKGKSKGGGDAASSVTKAAFMSTQKKSAEAAGIAFDEAKAETAFATQDKNGDGVLTADEKTTTAKGKKGAKGKKK